MSAAGEPQLAVGLDVGGTKIAAGLVDLASGHMWARRLEPTRAERGGAAVLQTCAALAASLCEEARTRGREVQGIGIGIAEMVDLAGHITSAQTIDCTGLEPLRYFEPHAPAVIESDARAGALAEATFGRSKKRSSFLYVTVGTGISYCLVLDGRPYAGARGNAIVFANSPMVPFCPSCNARSARTLEEYAAGPALVRRYAEAGGQADHGRDVLTAAAKGEGAARAVVLSAASALGVGVGGLVNALDPEAVVVGGGLGTAPGLYWETFVASTRSHVWADTSRGLPIEQSALGTDTGVLGAAALVPLRFGRRKDH